MKQIFLILILGILVLGGYMYSRNTSPTAQNTDTSQSGTVATSTESETEDETWSESVTPESGVTFRYPPTLPTTYMRAVDWPPQVRVVDTAYECSEAGEETARAGKTEAVRVNGHTYCKTTVNEGAAGSMYSQYAYAAQKDGQHVVLTFTVQSSQCANYDEPQKTACETERQNFNVDQVADRMIESIRFNQ